MALAIFVGGCTIGPMVLGSSEMHFTRQGSGKPILLVHGYGGSVCSWHLVRDELSSLGEVTAVDLVGFGRTPPTQNFGFSLEEQSTELANFLATEFTEPPTIIAHSMGAAITLIALIEHRIDVEKAILVNALAYPQDTPFFIDFQNVPLLGGLVGQLVPPSVQVDTVLKYIFHDPKNISKKIRDCYVSNFGFRYHRRALRETAIQLKNFDGDFYISRYGNVNDEVHVIWGQADPLFDKGIGRRFRDEIGAKSYVEIPSCGHAPHEECPNDFLAQVRRILD